MELNIDVDVEAVKARFGKLAGRKLGQALARGLARGLDRAASEVVMQAHEKGLESRTGTLLNEVKGRVVNRKELLGFVGVPSGSPASEYAYLLTNQVKTIVPVQAQALTIPIAANLTGAGVATYPTVAALKEAFPGEVHRRGRAIGIGDDEQFEAYFGLAASVTVAGVDALESGVEAAQDDMVVALYEEVGELVREDE